MPATGSMDVWDAIVVGAGPAGLSAALILGRCRRRVLLCDRGTPRSWASKEMHGYLSRDPIPPDAFRRLGLDELMRYPSVEYREMEVTEAAPADDGGFSITTAAGDRFACRKLLIATGLFDELPPIDGVRELFGKSVFQCPYCDGWEMRDKPLAV